MLGAVGEMVVKHLGYLREGGGYLELERKVGFLVVIGVGAQLVSVELIPEVRKWEAAVVTAAVVEAVQQVTPLLLLPRLQRPPLQPEPGTIRKEKLKQGSGVREEDREQEEDLYLAVEIPEVGVCLTVIVHADSHLILKLP